MRTLALLVAVSAACTPAPDSGCESCGAHHPDAGASPDGAAVGCSPACAGLTPICNAHHHCVGCEKDADCAKGEYCRITSDAVARCAVGCAGDGDCAAGESCCGGRCIDPKSDAKNCGACGVECGAPHAAGACVGGACGPLACAVGWGDCDGDPKNGCEANLHADAANCTACGAACGLPNAFSGCADGCYLSACHFGFDDSVRTLHDPPTTVDDDFDAHDPPSRFPAPRPFHRSSSAAPSSRSRHTRPSAPAPERSSSPT